MEIKRKNQTYFSFVVFLILSLFSPACSELENTQINGSFIITAYEIHVGVILNMGSWAGKMSESCISMAVSDFYNLNSHYKTRLVLHTRDSKGDPMRTLSQALDLMRSIKLQAIVGGETSFEAKILAELGVKAKIPIISVFATGPSPSLAEYPYFVQIAQDGTSQFNGIAAIIQTFRWRSVNLIYEDTELIPYIISSFQDMEIHINYKISISSSSTDEQIIELISKLMTSSTTSVYVVHMSPSLACQLFLNAKKLGMMSEGYVWIITDKIVNSLHSMDSIVIESMKGTLGLKPYIQSSEELHNFTLRWKREFYTKNPLVQVMMELNVYGVRAYDTIWALALAAERVSNKISEIEDQDTELNLMDLATIRSSQSGSRLHMEILQCRFKGLGGDFRIIDGKLISREFEIVNVIGKGDRRVGFWTPRNGIMKDMNQSMKRKNFFSPTDLEAIIWPGGSTTIPKSRMMYISDKKLKIGVPIQSRFHELLKVSRDPQTNTTVVTGFCIDVFTTAIEALEYEVLFEFIPFEDDNGHRTGTYYNDLIYQVYLQNYDAVVGDVTINANRSLYVDFTLPFTDLGLGMIVPNNNDMWIFLKPLTAELWVTSAVFFILIGFVVWVIEHRTNGEFQGPPTQQIGTVFWFSFSTLVYAHREKLQSNLSKFVVIVWLFVVLILSSSYTATLASMLTIQQIQVSSGNYIIGYRFGTVSSGVISNMHFIDSKIKSYRYTSPEAYADALSRGIKNGGVSAIIDEIPYIKIFLARYPSRFTMIEPTFISNGFGFVFPKGSPLVPDISREIAKLREEGKLRMMENEWFKGQSTITADDQYPTSNPTSLNLSHFRGLFLISGLSSTLALVIFSIFMFYERRHVIGICWNLIRGRLEFLKRYITIIWLRLVFQI